MTMYKYIKNMITEARDEEIKVVYERAKYKKMGLKFKRGANSRNIY